MLIVFLRRAMKISYRLASLALKNIAAGRRMVLLKLQEQYVVLRFL